MRIAAHLSRGDDAAGERWVASPQRVYLVPELAPDLPPDLAPIDVPADPNGLAYDRDRETLYVADGETGAILAVEQGRPRRVAAIDSGGVVASNRLGGIAVAPDGTLCVARLGHGFAGAIFRVGRAGSIAGAAPVVLAGLSPALWRLGITHGAELAGGRAHACTTLATDIDRPDSIAARGPDSVVISTFDGDARIGGVRRLWLDGTSQLIARGDWEARGVATDGRRVFVAARRGGRILVFPI
ncbi:MAG TPA: hypothetical protein VLM79_14950 [Kofleriaceae bacterium]|nr:hypothetical protein [Kofleriaceae bacterium]